MTVATLAEALRVQHGGPAPWPGQRTTNEFAADVIRSHPVGDDAPSLDADPLIPDPEEWLRANWTAPLTGQDFIRLVKANSVTRRVVRRIVEAPR